MEQAKTKEATRGRVKLLNVQYTHYIGQTKKLRIEDVGMANEQFQSGLRKAINTFKERFPTGIPCTVQLHSCGILVEGKREETKKEKEVRLAAEKREKDFKLKNAEREKANDMATYERIKKKYKL